MELVNDPQLGGDPAVASQPSTASVGDVPKMDLERTLPRQISTGIQRGIQSIAGDQIVAEPVNGIPVITTSGINQNQTFSDPNTQKPVIITGRQTDGTYSQRVVDTNGITVAQFGQQVDGTINLKFFSSPDENGNTTGIAQFGRFTDGTTALKISPPGIEVSTATDSQLIFNSNQNIFKIVDKLTAPFTLTSGAVSPTSTTVTINHDLGYVPLILPTVNITTLTNGTPGIYPVPFFTPGVGGGTTNVYIMLSYLRVSAVTDTQIRFNLGIQAPTQTFEGTFICYVLQETAT